MPTPCAKHLLASLFAIVAVAEVVLAQLVPTGEFQANTYTIGNQASDSHVKLTCAAADGDFVVVWSSNEQDGLDNGVFGQRFASTGLRVGTEFQVNTFTLDDEREPDLCCDRDGDFVVLWHSRHDGDGRGVFGQRFTSSASRIGDEFQVNSYTPGDQEDPSVCCNGQGGFLAVWESEGQDEDQAGIYAQRYGSSGSALGDEFQVNSYTDNDQEDPAVCCAADGAFVAVWNMEATDDLAGQRFASSGAPLGSEFVVNTYTPDVQGEPAICCSAEGDFVVAWESYDQDGHENGVFGQRFARDGDRLGAEFQATTFTVDDQQRPAACCDSVGNFVVTWQSYGQDAYYEGIFAQRFASNGSHLGGEFQANVYTLHAQNLPSLACDDRGGFVVVWGSFGQDGDGVGIFGRRFFVQLASSVPVLGWASLAVLVVLLAGFGIVRLVRLRS